METLSIDREIARAISAATGAAFDIRRAHAVGGGCINHARVVADGARRFFVKSNLASRYAGFEAEADGLAALDAAEAVRVPAVITLGTAGETSFLVLEYLELGATADHARLGMQLAELHRVRGPHFGWPRDNFIGATPQVNAPGTDWRAFFAEHRLHKQLAFARAAGRATSLQTKGARLGEELHHFFAGYAAQPSLLHGDLWGGNAAFLIDGTPVLFDPAAYWGDREADIAMTELFGGFASDFYAAYASAWPLDPGYAVRRDLYNLYHVLNHFNLFGGGYQDQAERLVDKLLARLRG